MEAKPSTGQQTELQLPNWEGSPYLPILRHALLIELIQQNQPALLENTRKARRARQVIADYLFEQRNLNYPPLQVHLNESLYFCLRGVKKMMQRRTSLRAFLAVALELAEAKAQLLAQLQA